MRSVSINSMHIKLDDQRLALLSDLASRRHQEVDAVVNDLLCDALDDYYEEQNISGLIRERDNEKSKFVPYDSKIWE